MKRRLALLPVFTLFMLAACASPLQEELLTYINEELPELSKVEDEVMKDYQEVLQSNADNEQAIADSLKSDVIPAYTKIADEAGNLTIEDGELKKLHSRYIDAVNDRVDALDMVAQSIEQQNEELYNEADEKLNKASEDMNAFNEDLEAYALENDLEMEEPKE
ncbi:hypothetical protein GKZ89_14915 [Bacillus mangrovi]|uniref:Lipoprotein n=1 Tax=Metabacillus mangrovi TaxID=1491830 RepID=A0A7X2S6S7_9BACI|nr:hypothetical protein [Metabacillus mangrovi]MTH54692.1 hypothetical protein [Metabacillus mangrovi]